MTSKAEKNKEKLEALRKNRISPTGALVGALNESPSTVLADEKEEHLLAVEEESPALASLTIPEFEIKEQALEIPVVNEEPTNVLNKEVVRSVNGTVTEPTLPDFETPATLTTAKGRFGKLKNKVKKQRVEDTHSRKTFLVRNDLLDELESISQGIHGFKIEFINTAIENALKDYREELEDE